VDADLHCSVEKVLIQAPARQLTLADLGATAAASQHEPGQSENKS
jgi:hypothetical protein